MQPDQTLDQTLIASFAPAGPLRIVINAGNPVLAGVAADGQARGVSVDLGRAFAASLGLEAELIVVDTAGKSVDLVADERADIGFFAIDPLRGARIAFTPPYVLIEGTYLVRAGDALTRVVDVDRDGTRVVVGKGSAYDLFLTRELKHATIVRTALSQAVVQTMLDDGCEVAAGVRQQLEADARRIANVRVLDGRFMTIRQAMGLPKSRGVEAAAFLSRFVESRKASGFVAEALTRHAIEGASVAPAGDLTKRAEIRCRTVRSSSSSASATRAPIRVDASQRGLLDGRSVRRGRIASGFAASARSRASSARTVRAGC